MSRGRKSGSPNITASSLIQNEFNHLPPVADASDDLEDGENHLTKKRTKKQQVAPVITEALEEGDLLDLPVAKEVIVAKSPVAEVAPEPLSEYASMGMFEKVKLMSNIQAALFSDDVKKAILSKPDGSKVYEVFSKAMEVEIGRIMGAEPGIPEATTAEVMGEYFDALASMNYLVRLFSEQRLINLLAGMFQQSGGQLPVVSAKSTVKPPVARPVAQQQVQSRIERPEPGYNPLFE